MMSKEGDVKSYVEPPRYPGNAGRRVVVHWKETITYETVLDVNTSAAVAQWLNERLDKSPFEAVRSMIEKEEIDLSDGTPAEVIDIEDRNLHDVYIIEGYCEGS